MKRLYIFIDRRFHIFFCYIIFLIIIQIAENPFVENNSQHNADGDAGVGEIEDGREEIRAAPKRELVGKREELEVEHIDHLAEEERSVTVPWRPLRHFQEVALGEKQPVEHAVDDVAEGAGDHQTENGQHNPVHLVAFQPVNEIPAERAHQEDAHNGEEQFPDLLTETDAESHPFVLDKMDVEPLTYQWKCLPYSQMRLYPEFDNLINYDE